MYKDTGNKILTMANVIAGIGIAASVIGGIITMQESVLLGLGIVIIGSLLAWVSCLLMAGFVELVLNTLEMVNLLRKANSGASAYHATGMSEAFNRPATKTTQDEKEQRTFQPKLSS